MFLLRATRARAEILSSKFHHLLRSNRSVPSASWSSKVEADGFRRKLRGEQGGAEYLSVERNVGGGEEKEELLNSRS